MKERKTALYSVVSYSRWQQENSVKYSMDYFLRHLMLTSTVATRLTAKVRETVEKQFLTEIKMLNRVTSSYSRDCNYCSLCLQMYGVGAGSCSCYPIIKCSKWGKGRMPSYIRLFWCISRSKNTKKKEMPRQYQVFKDF